MQEQLPYFKYHPDPVATGMVQASDATCPCCGNGRGYAYAAKPYCVEEVEDLCPWCIADGSAAAKFEAEFVDTSPLISAGIPSSVVEEISERTPGFISWQQEIWLTCCNDACEFHGDMPAEEFRNLADEDASQFRVEHEIDADWFKSLQKHYQPGGSPAVYKFVCRHCRRIRLGMDFD